MTMGWVPGIVQKRAETCVYCQRLIDSIEHGVFREAAYSEVVVIMSRVIEEQQGMILDFNLNGLPPVYVIASEEAMERLKGEVEARRESAEAGSGVLWDGPRTAPRPGGAKVVF